MSKDTTFRVEFVDGTTVEMDFGTDTAAALRRDLDRATTILGCPDCGDLAPVTGGLPEREMPRCPQCGKSLRGVTEVHEIGDGGHTDGGQRTSAVSVARDLAGLFDAECSSAEALDFFMTTKGGFSQRAWADVRGVGRTAVANNVRKTREKLAASASETP